MVKRKAVITILSDDDTGIESLAVLLEESYIVYELKETDDVKNLMSERPVDIVIINLDRMVEERLRLISYIKNDRSYHNVLVGTISEGIGTELSNRAISLGANYSFRHPINAARIKRQIDNDVSTFIGELINVRDGHFDLVSRAMNTLRTMNMGYISLYLEDEFFTEFVGENALKLLGYDNGNGPSTRTVRVSELVHPSDYGDFYDMLTAIVDSEDTHNMVLRVKTATMDYQRFEIHVKGFEVWDGVRHFSVIIRRSDNDEPINTDLRAELAIYRENSKIDILTGLYNKETFFLEGARYIEEHPETPYVVTVWDIDRFKAINEMFGTAAGDRLIIDFAEYLRKELASGDNLCGRISSDHFISMTPLDFHERNLVKMHRIVYGEVKWHSLDYKVYMHAGIYRLEPQDDSIAVACDRATMAMQAVKDSYINRINYFTKEMRDGLLYEQELVRKADPAIAGNEFFVMYQPIVDSHTREIVSAEALVRWRKQDGGLISPGDFIPTFEKNGFITKLDLFVWEQVCRFQSFRKMEGKKTVPISVNLSRIDFYNEDLYEKLQSIVDRYGIDSSLIKVEVTESAYMDQPETLMNIVERFRRSGHQILMDDFGSGFSSFNMLKDFAVDILKIDMKFMDSLDTSERAGNILYSIIQMAKAIHMQIVAEGVETSNQYEMLKNMDCDCIQGYYFHRPLTEGDFIKQLETSEAEIATDAIGLYDRILLLTGDKEQPGQLTEIMENRIELHTVSTAKEADEFLKKSFSSVSLILVDYESIPEECEAIIKEKNSMIYFTDIPLVIIARSDNIKNTQVFIGHGAIDAIRTPFEKNVVKQRLRRLIDYYGMQTEKRTINVLKKSMLLRQQLNSFFEDSIAGIARIIIDRQDNCAIKEVSYVNERFLELHGITLEEALKAERLERLTSNVLFTEVESFSDAVYYSITEKAHYVSREYLLEKKDGSAVNCLAACSLLYLGEDVKMDLVVLESPSSTEERAMDFISAICARANDDMNMRVFRYYFDDDIMDHYRRGEDGGYIREILYNALDNLLAGFDIPKTSREAEGIREMIYGLKIGEKRVEKNLILHVRDQGKNCKRWYRMTFERLETAVNRRCALCIIENISRDNDLEHLVWTNNVYNRVMNENAVFYLEADITDNRVINEEAFDILKAYGLPEIFTYDEFVKVFDMTVSSEHIEEVRNIVERQRLLSDFEGGSTYKKFSFISKTLDVPVWTDYDGLILLEKDPENGHVCIGLRITESEKV
ncbi:MAG TPA: hypothetical protein DCL38_04920 [Lachnospiraceae bacterium]|nr:hypothetical protein [Lachnospiraceae bacterium]